MCFSQLTTGAQILFNFALCNTRRKPDFFYLLRSVYSLDYWYYMSTECESVQEKSPSKQAHIKQSFNLEPDVAGMLSYWKKDNRNTIKSRMINEALRRYLASYSRKRRMATDIRIVVVISFFTSFLG